MSINIDASSSQTELRSLYERAHDGSSLRKYIDVEFAEDLIEHVGIEHDLREARFAGIDGLGIDEDLGALLVFPGDTRLFVGTDTTARDSGWFGFLVGEPAETVDDVRNLLTPDAAQDARRNGLDPHRQGEWFLVETDRTPAGTIQKPGVNSRPYGGSPLENHVPREYALGVDDATFLERAQRILPDAARVEEPHDAIEYVHQIHAFDDDPMIEAPDEAPWMEELREIAEDIFVRGTVRHRERDHFMASIGDEWHLAVTHDFHVYTPSDGDDWDYEQNDDGWWERVSHSSPPVVID